MDNENRKEVRQASDGKATVRILEGPSPELEGTNFDGLVIDVSASGLCLDPDQWQHSLGLLRDLDEEVFVPGHGAVCDKKVLSEQSAFIEEWVDYVSQAVNRGMEKDVAIKELTGMTDRYPMDIGIEHWTPRVMQMNVANLYDFVCGEGIHKPG